MRFDDASDGRPRPRLAATRAADARAALTERSTIPARTARRSGRALTELSLGGAQLGNLYRAIDDDAAHATVDAAWQRGIRYFDTAPHYGLGLSERRLGFALAGRPRDEYVVSTKVGRLLEPIPSPAGRDADGFDVRATHRRVWNFTRDGVLRSLESSLERLGLDHVDLVYLHDPDDHWDDALRRAYPALEELRGQGVVAGIGAGMNQSAMLVDFARHTDMDTFMLAGRHTLLEHGALAELLPLCAERGIGVVAAGVFNSGLLASAEPSRGARYDYEEASAEVVERARMVAAVCVEHGTSLPAAAIAFPLAHPAVVSVCLGARSAAQIERDADLYEAGVPAELWRALRGRGLIP